MTCNCLAEISENIKTHNNANNPKFSKNPIMNVSFKDVIFNLDKGYSLLKTYVEIVCEGRKSPIKEPLVLIYCPFCGKKYSELKNENPSQN